MEVFYNVRRVCMMSVYNQSMQINWFSPVGEIFGDEVHMRGRARVHSDLFSRALFGEVRWLFPERASLANLHASDDAWLTNTG